MCGNFMAVLNLLYYVRYRRILKGIESLWGCKCIFIIIVSVIIYHYLQREYLSACKEVQM